MAQYQHLPIYKATYELLRLVTHATSNFPKAYKYSLGDKLRAEVVEMVVFIFKANSSRAQLLRHLQPRQRMERAGAACPHAPLRWVWRSSSVRAHSGEVPAVMRAIISSNAASPDFGFPCGAGSPTGRRFAKTRLAITSYTGIGGTGQSGNFLPALKP